MNTRLLTGGPKMTNTVKRRDFLALTSVAMAAGITLPSFAIAAPLDFKPGVVDARLQAGETVFLDFKASWCTTCAAQERVLDKLKAAEPAYENSRNPRRQDQGPFGCGPIRHQRLIPSFAPR